MESLYLPCIGAAWLAGIYAASLVLPHPALLWGGAGLSLLSLVGGFLWRAAPRWRLAAFCAMLFFLGGLRFSWAVPHFDEGDIAHYNDGGEITLRGIVEAEPDVRDTYQNVRVGVSGVLSEGGVRDAGGTLLLSTARYPSYAYGDLLEITGEPRTPPVYDTFSYRDYLARRGIYSVMRYGRVEVLESGAGNPFRAALYGVRRRAADTIARMMPEPQAGLLTGILLGVESGIPRGLYEEFNATGTSHVIVISGFNISILAGIFVWLGTKTAGRRWAAPGAVSAIVLYTLLVGADSAVVRAAIMGVLYVLAMHFGRQSYALISLALSALLMSIANPYVLWDVSFQLSFMATLGIITLAPPMQEKALELLARPFGEGRARRVLGVVNEAFIVGLAAQIAVAPVIIYHFGRFSTVSFPANFLILPVQPAIMVLGGIATMLGMAWLPMGQVVGWFAWLPLAWTVWVVRLMARFPYASVEVGRGGAWLLVAIYAVAGGGVWLMKSSGDERGKWLGRLPYAGTVGALVFGVGLVWAAVFGMPDGRLHVTFLDVGQGDAILITTPGGSQVLVDGGPGSAALLSGLGDEMPFWDRKIEMVINTHPDADHLSGLLAVLERYTVESVVVGDAEDDSALYREWEGLLEERGITPVVALQGMRISLGDGVTAEVLNPGPACEGIEDADKANNRSVVLRLTFGKACFLLPGDVETAVERKLVKGGLVDGCAVLKSPHHGSDTSSSEAFLAAVHPLVVVVSVGEGNNFGHPADDVIERYESMGAHVFRTDLQGSVSISTDGESLSIRTARQ